jgi:hypothetical protein
MTTSGLVVKLDPDSPDGARTLAAIRANPVFTVGDQNGRWLSVVLEASDPDESEHWHDWLCRLPGVDGAEVVFVHMDEEEFAHVDA